MVSIAIVIYNLVRRWSSENSRHKRQMARSKRELAVSGEQGVKGEDAIVPPSEGRWLLTLPNPVTNILRLQVPDSKEQVVQTTLLDAAGRQVLSRTFVPETNTHQEEFGVSELPTGMYFMKVTTPEKSALLKVVKL